GAFYGPFPTNFWGFILGKNSRVFVLDQRNLSGLQGFRDAQQACSSQHARLAAVEELHHAVAECFFSECTRGWLHGGAVGTTVCNAEGSSLKTVKVRVENATEDAAHLRAFCIKDKAEACGDPPSFPNAHLQEQSGSEMGDELLYKCVPGYVMPTGHAAFSLLCDSCGEWYGAVQICIKGEKHEKLEEHRLTLVSSDEADTSVRHAIRRSKVVGTDAAATTEEPVSLLSQKHLFWFPSEAFQEKGLSFSTDSVTQTTQRVSGSQSQESKENETKEGWPNITQRGTGGKTTKGQTWLDGYPVQDAEISDSTKKPPRSEDGKTTEKPNEVEVRRQVPHTSSSDKVYSPTMAPDQEVVKKVRPGIRTPGTSHDQLEHSDSPSYSDTLDYDTQQVAPTHSWLDELTEHPFLDHGPAPPAHNSDIFTGAMGEHAVHNLPGEMGEVEGEMGEAMCVGEHCPPHPPKSASRGPTVAAIIVVMCAVAMAVIFGVWCYRRQQQKSSIYEMNEKGPAQTRPGQQIEMQQKV
uniref:Sushi domain containing 5 n=1 Tax=Nothobranchius furzeri TaxID=105023 RepID=A0A8C6PCU3_NOTFU